MWEPFRYRLLSEACGGPDFKAPVLSYKAHLLNENLDENEQVGLLGRQKMTGM